ncbi:MAG TPA: prephenate dehydrogenase/arogenate dehydrogenase family protein [Burkholderiales bacterium]|nr:prephenate dehydrogenase/arogenate dehydrogenase family protein [Burkholderiales bacterium]
MNEFHCDKLVVVGVGLIGGSVACALRNAGRVGRIVGVGRGGANIRRALELGVIDESSDDLKAAARGADVVLLAVPVQQNDRVLGALAQAADARTLVTDAGSTKMDFVASARRLLPGKLSNVVPGHPIAGAELTGVEAARPDLFAGRNVVLTPMPESRPDCIERVQSLWQTCGARVSRMTPEHHDRVFSAVSHLPHMLAYALVHMVATRADAQELFGFAAGGFRDFTRIAGSSPEMWRDIAIANREALLADIDGYRDVLDRLAALIRDGDAGELGKLFEQAREARNAWLRKDA